MDEQLVQELRKKVELLESELESLKRVLETHDHDGVETKRLSKDVDLEANQSFGAGGVAKFTGYTEANGQETTATYSLIRTGEDSNPADGTQVTELLVKHLTLNDDLQNTDNANLSSVYSRRGPMYFGSTGSFKSGESIFRQVEYKWVPSSLSGSIFLLRNPNGTTAIARISTNDERSLTLSGVNFSTTSDGVVYEIYTQTQLGAPDYPWRVLYVSGDALDGGIHLKTGNVGGGQLYSDEDGELYWAKANGSIIQLTP